MVREFRAAFPPISNVTEFLDTVLKHEHPETCSTTLALLVRK